MKTCITQEDRTALETSWEVLVVNHPFHEQPKEVHAQIHRRLNRTLTVMAFVLTAFAASAQGADFLTVIDTFLFQQMEVFDSVRPTNQPPLIQTYAIRNITDPFYGLLFYRGDVYDQALAICYLLERNESARASRLADALLFLQDHDAIPDGRLHTAYWPNNLLDLQGQYTSVESPDIAAGNMSWAGIALTRTFRVTGDGKYLTGAMRCADWILQNLKHDDGPGGFSGGLLDWTNQPAGWRGTEHNIDIFVLANGLYNLTRDSKWLAMANHAKSFVQAMFSTNGYYFTGTLTNGVTINPSPIPADGISWTALAQVDTTNRASQSLQWLKDQLVVQDVVGPCTFIGVKFSSDGSHIQSEMTASAAMAYSIQRIFGDAQMLLTNLAFIQASATNSDGNGIVATPWPDGAPTGFGSSYVNRMHVASSAWSGLAMLVAQGDFSANPLYPVPGFSVHIARSGSVITLTWSRVPGRDYDILISTNLADYATVPVGQTNVWTDTVSDQIQSRFYRINMR